MWRWFAVVTLGVILVNRFAGLPPLVGVTLTFIGFTKAGAQAVALFLVSNRSPNVEFDLFRWATEAIWAGVGSDGRARFPK